MTKVCILGMGFVGVTMAAALAEKGFGIFGVDINEKVVEKLKKGEIHFHEKGLDEALARNKERMEYSTKMPKEKMDCYIICVGTPINPDKSINTAFIENSVSMISENLKGGELIVLRSTVKAGISRKIVKPLLDRSGKEYYLSFCPERTIEGKALEEIVELPQIIGGIDEAATKKAAEFFSKIAKENVIMDSIEEAEMVKLLNNAYRDMTFAFANEAAIICDGLGIKASKVISAANHNYKRSSIPKPGFVGGICLSKDSFILAGSAEKHPLAETLIVTARKINDSLPKLVARKVSENVDRKDAIIIISGIAFKGKPETDDTRNSPAVSLIDELKKEGFEKIVCHDFVVSKEKMKELGLEAVGIEEGVKMAEAIIIANNNEKYKEKGFAELLSKHGKKIIFDAWSIVDTESLDKEKLIYETL